MDPQFHPAMSAAYAGDLAAFRGLITRIPTLLQFVAVDGGQLRSLLFLAGVAPGIRSTMRDSVNDFNFGVINIISTGSGARIEGAVAHEGTSFGYGVDIADLV